MSRISLLLSSSSCILVLLLCLSQQCCGRHLSSVDDHAAMDDKAKLLNQDSIIKGLGNDLFTVHNELDHQKQIDSGSKNKKDMIKEQKVKKFKEVGHQRQQHDPKSITFRVPMKNKRFHKQPGFNLDYSPPKTHPPVHN